MARGRKPSDAPQPVLPEAGHWQVQAPSAAAAKVAGYWLEHAGPARKANAVHSFMLDVFGPEFWVLFGYDDARWNAEYSRRGGKSPAARLRARDKVARLEAQAWERTLAQRVANERAAMAQRATNKREAREANNHAASAQVAAALLDGWLMLLQDGAGKMRPESAAASVAVYAYINGDNDVLCQLTEAIHEVTRRWLTMGETDAQGLAVPVIRGRLRDPSEQAALLDVVRAAARTIDPHPSAASLGQTESK